MKNTTRVVQHVTRGLGLLAVLAVAVLGWGAPVRASQVSVGETLSVGATPAGDAYVAGGQVVVDGATDQDLIVAGGSVIVNDNVGADLLVTGGSVVVNADVGDDVRAAGGSLTLSGNVGGDVLLFAGALQLTSGATIEGDLIVFGGAVVLDGNINGSLTATAGQAWLRGNVAGATQVLAEELEVDGTVGGNATLMGSNVFRIGDGASLEGDVRYFTKRGHVDFGSALKGTATYDATLASREVLDGSALLKFILLGAVASIVWNAVLLLVVMLLVRKPFQRAAEHLDKHVWADLGWGALVFVGVPIVATLLMVTFVGFPVGVLLWIGYGALLIVSKVLPGVVLVYWWERRSKRTWTPAARYFIALAIVIVLQLIALIPIVGWIVNLAALFAALGALTVVKYQLYKQVR